MHALSFFFKGTNLFRHSLLIFHDLVICIFAFILFAGVVIGSAHANTQKSTLTAISTFNLKNTEFKNETRIKLTGNWCFNWQEFISPREPCPKSSSPISLPSKWNKQPDPKQSFPRHGFASYSSTILISNDAPPLGLYVPILYRSAEFFINGEPLLKVGQPATTKAAEIPRDARFVIPLPTNQTRLEIVVHVSSFHHIDGGMNKALEIAPLQVLLQQERIRSFSSIFLVGSSLSTAIFFLFVGITPAFKKNYVYVLGAIAILTYSIRVMGIEQVWLWVNPDASALWILRLEYFGLVLSFPAYLYYLYYLFPGIVNRYLCRVAVVFSFTCVVFISFFPAEVFAWLRDPWVVLYIFSLLYYVYCIGLAIYRKKPDSMLIGSIVIVVILTTTNDLFLWFNLFDGNNLINFTYFFLILGNASILSLRMIRGAKRETELTNEIQQLNIDLQLKVKQRTEELAQRMTELDQQRMIAEHANTDKSRLLAAASHDLRQPLHAMSLFMDAIQHAESDGQRKPLLDQLEQALDSLSEMFDALLDISKLDAAAIDLVKCPVQINPLFNKLLQEYSTLAQNKGLQLHFRPTDAVVYSDPLWLERILRNLLSNAIRYTNKGKVLLSCRKRGDQWLLQVWDTGTGINETQQDTIFNEFTQLKSAANQHQNGMGLGLAIVSRLVALLGHSISVKSQPSRGSVFNLLTAANDPAITNVAAKPSVKWRTSNRLDGTKILVIDDDLNICTAMTIMLENWHCEVLTANSPEQVLTLLKHQESAPDIIVSDYHLGAQLNGLELIKRIQQQHKPPIPTMFISGETAPEVIQAIETSGYRILHKPVQPAKMRVMLASLITKK